MTKAILFLSLLLLAGYSSYASDLPETHSPRVYYELPPEGVVAPEPNKSSSYFHNPYLLRVEGYDLTGALPSFAGVHPDVTMLYLNHCGVLTASDMDDLKLFPRLRYLKICRAGLDDATIVRLLNAVPKCLFFLELGESKITDTGLIAMLSSERLAGLRELCLWNEKVTGSITFAGLNVMASSWFARHLKKFYLSDMPKGEALTAMATDFILRTSVEYSAFYEESSDRHCLLDSPADESYTWLSEDGEWYLYKEPSLYDGATDGDEFYFLPEKKSDSAMVSYNGPNSKQSHPDPKLEDFMARVNAKLLLAAAEVGAVLHTESLDEPSSAAGDESSFIEAEETWLSDSLEDDTHEGDDTHEDIP